MSDFSDDFDDILGGLFDAVESPEDNIRENSPECEELVTIKERYKRDRLLGEGGVKKVWQVYDLRSRSQLAYAEPKNKLHPAFYDELLEEAWLTASLSHPNIIKIHDVGVSHEGAPYFTMDIKRGPNLAAWKLDHRPQKYGSIALEESLEIFLKVCDAISHAHKSGVLHLDLKPENIQIVSLEDVVVCDWGLGRKLTEELTQRDEYSNAGTSIKGTPGYMSPEAIEREGSVDCRSDVYGLGAVLYFLLTGNRPFTGKSVVELIDETRKGEVISARLRYPTMNISRALDAIIVKALALSPEDRYQTVDLLCDDIRAFRRGRPTSLQTGRTIGAWLFYQRNQFTCNSVILAIILLISGAIWSSQQIMQQMRAREAMRVYADKAAAEADEAKSLLTLTEKQMHEYVDADQESRSRLAKQLIDVAEKSKETFIHLNTNTVVDMTEQSARLAIALDPTLTEARMQLASVHFIKKNFTEAKRIARKHSDKDNSIRKFYESCPDLDLSKGEQLTLDELAEVIDLIGDSKSSIYHRLVMRLLWYDNYTRTGTKNYKTIVEEHFRNICDNYKDFVCTYEKGTITMGAILPEKPRFIVSVGPLKVLDIHSCVLSGNWPHQIWRLRLVRPKKIDLQNRTVKDPVKDILALSSTVNHLVVRSGVYTDKQLALLQKYMTVTVVPVK